MAEGEEKAKNVDEQELERLAVESLLEDVRRRKSRVEEVGTMGWVKERNVNKRFLNSLVLQTIPRQHAPRREDKRLSRRSSDKYKPFRREGRINSDHTRAVDGDRSSGVSGSKRRVEDTEISEDKKHSYSRPREYSKSSSHRIKRHSSQHWSRERHSRDRESKRTSKRGRTSRNIETTS